jgi:hypothetical protein
MDDADREFLSDGERAFLLALNRLGVRYLLVGMSAALLQGARGATEDIDIWFESTADPRIGEAAREAGGFWITRTAPPMLGGAIGDRFDVVTMMSGLPDFAAEYGGAKPETLSGADVKVLPLARILHSKLAAGRAKDGPGIEQIRLALAVLEQLKHD